MTEFLQNKNKKMKKDLLLDVIILQMLFLCGGEIWFVRGASITIPVWLLTCFLYNRKHGSYSILMKNMSIYLPFFLIVVFSTFIIGEETRSLMFASVLLLPFGMSILLASIDFNVFRIHLLKVVNALLLVSIIVQLLHNFSIIPAAHSRGYLGGISLYLFQTEWGQFDTLIGVFYRMSSVYWEPGMFQIVLVYTLMLYTDILREKITDIKFLLKNFGFIFLSFILSASTMGYLCLFLILIYLFTFSNAYKRHKFVYSFYLIIGGFFMFLLMNSSIVTDKLEQRELGNDSSSFIIRQNDNIACFNVALENPFWGLGCDTKSLHRQVTNAGSRTSSNGWLFGMAMFGIPLILFMWAMIYHNLKLRIVHKKAIFVWVILILSQCNEYLVYFPCVFMYIYRFKSYDKTIQLFKSN